MSQTLKTDQIPPGLRRGEWRRWWTFGAAMVLLACLGGIVVIVVNANGKANRDADARAVQDRKISAAQSAQASQVAANKTLSECQATWSRLTSERSKRVSKYNLQKELALSALLDLGAGDPHRPAALVTYHHTQAALAKELSLYPPPVYKCDLPSGVPTPSLTPSPLPAPTTVFSTRSATATATMVRPGSTVTRTVVVNQHGKRPTVTHTVTRTRTVAPPSCLVHPLPPCTLG